METVCLRDWRSLESSIEWIGPRGIIWDFDGVLCDSVRVFRELVATRLECCGLDDIAVRVRSDVALAGRETIDVVGEILRDVSGYDVGEFAKQLVDEYERVAGDMLSLDVGAIGIVRRTIGRGRKHCIVSNGRPDLIRIQVASAGLNDAFDPIVTPTGKLRPKPSPEMFEFAVSALGLRREECIVVEDSEVGASAALAAGLNVLRVALFE